MADKRKHQTGLLMAALAVALLVAGAVVVSAGNGHGGGLLAALHGGDGACPMGPVHARLEQIAGKLNLTPEQRAYLDRAHKIAQDHIHAKAQSNPDDMASLLAAIGDGTLDRTQTRAKIDSHLEEFRGVAYGVSDELVRFVQSLDPTQRTLLRDELTQMHQEIHQALLGHLSASEKK